MLIRFVEMIKFCIIVRIRLCLSRTYVSRLRLEFPGKQSLQKYIRLRMEPQPNTTYLDFASKRISININDKIQSSNEQSDNELSKLKFHPDSISTMFADIQYQRIFKNQVLSFDTCQPTCVIFQRVKTNAFYF